MAETSFEKKKQMRETKIRLEIKHHEAISKAAEAFGLDVASYVRRAALKEAFADLEQLQNSPSAFPSNENVTRLSEDEGANFLRYIESNPKPHTRLTALKKKYYGK